METQYVPSVQATDEKGETYARIAPTSFPRGPEGDSVVVHRVTAYNKKALWDAVEAWFEGGAPASGVIDPAGASRAQLSRTRGATWRIYKPSVPKEERVPLAWNSFATPMAPDPNTFGYRWNDQLVTRKDSKDGPLVTLPEYYRLVKDDKERPQWVVVQPEDVPAETGLAEVSFSRPDRGALRTLRHSRRSGELLEEARPRGRTFPGASGGRQRGDVLLVSIRRPAGIAQRRFDG